MRIFGVKRRFRVLERRKIDVFCRLFHADLACRWLTQVKCHIPWRKEAGPWLRGGEGGRSLGARVLQQEMQQAVSRGVALGVLQGREAFGVSGIDVRAMRDEDLYDLLRPAGGSEAKGDCVMQRCLAVKIVPGIDLGAEGQQDFGDIGAALHRRVIQCMRPDGPIEKIGIGTGFQQDLERIGTVDRPRHQRQQWSASQVVGGVDLGAERDQQRNDPVLSGQRRRMQRAHSAIARKFDVGPGIEECVHQLDRAKPGSHMQRSVIRRPRIGIGTRLQQQRYLFDITSLCGIEELGGMGRRHGKTGNKDGAVERQQTRSPHCHFKILHLDRQPDVTRNRVVRQRCGRTSFTSAVACIILFHVLEKNPAVYLLANRYRGTIYAGVTSDLWTRVANHKNGSMPGFTTKYGVKTLVWYEHRRSMEVAIRREKQIKFWKRD